MAETVICPRRAEGVLPGYPDHDEWVTNHWIADHDEAERKRQEWLANNPNSSIGATQGEWLWSWGPPRTCSFCGGIHPEDAIRLISEGWEVDPTTKPYKRYLEPPGMRQKHKALIAALDRGDDSFRSVPSVWSPGPPVKLYTMHFDQDQIDRFNAALATSKEQ